MRKSICIGIVASLLTIACQQKEKVEQTAETVVAENTSTPQRFGVSINEGQALSLASLLQQATGKEQIADLTVKGKVVEVCQAKGCWMTVEKPDGSTMRVKFKDYALFMPKDIAGREVVMHGVAKVTTTSVDELKHLAQDGGKSAEEIATITEAQTQLAFEADGVLIR